MPVSRRRLENSAKVVSKEKGGRNDRKRSNGTADWLGIQVDVSLPAMRVLRSLSQIIKWRGTPETMRGDNRPEYVRSLLIQWAKKRGTATDIISRASRNKPPITSATTAWFGTNGWTKISLNQERRLWTYNTTGST